MQFVILSEFVLTNVLSNQSVACAQTHAQATPIITKKDIYSNDLKKNVEIRRKPISDQSCWFYLKSISSWGCSLRVTLSAVYRSAPIGLEGNFTFLSTFSANCLVHLFSFIRQLSQLLHGCCAKTRFLHATSSLHIGAYKQHVQNRKVETYGNRIRTHSTLLQCALHVHTQQPTLSNFSFCPKT